MNKRIIIDDYLEEIEDILNEELPIYFDEEEFELPYESSMEP